MPVAAVPWRRQPELRLAGSEPVPLRLLARRLGSGAMPGLGRERLTTRILQQRKTPSQLGGKKWLPRSL